MEKIIVSTPGARLGKEVIRQIADGKSEIIELSENPSRNADYHQRTSLSDLSDVLSSLQYHEGADYLVHIPTGDRISSTESFVNISTSIRHILEGSNRYDINTTCVLLGIEFLFSTSPQFEEFPINETMMIENRCNRIEEFISTTMTSPLIPENIVILWYPWVKYDSSEPDMTFGEYGTIEEIRELVFSNARRPNPLFAYIKIESLIKAIRNSFGPEIGYEEFLLSAPDSVVSLASNQLVAEFYPEADADLSENQSLITTDKARKLLNWDPSSE